MLCLQAGIPEQWGGVHKIRDTTEDGIERLVALRPGRLVAEEVEEDVPPKGFGVSEDRPTPARGHQAADEGDELGMVGEHEDVEARAEAPEPDGLLQGGGDDPLVEPPGVFVDAPVGEGEGRGLAVGDQDRLLLGLGASL